MTQPNNTLDTYDLTHDREDLIDAITMVDPETTPFMSMIGTGEAATNIDHEWTTDELAAANANNAAVEGDDADPQALTVPARRKNTTQISKKEFVISGTAQSIDVAGSEDEFLRQKLKKGIELRQDMEAILVRNQARVSGDSTTARRLRSMEAFITSNVSRGEGGANGSDTVAATDGTARAFDEAYIKDVAESLAVNAANFPTVMMCHPSRRKGISGLIQGGNNRIDFESGVLKTSVKVYESDFGDLALVNNRHMRSSGLALLNPDLWEVNFLQGRDFIDEPLAKTGDSTKHMMLSEFTLTCFNEKGNGFVADLI